MHSWISLDERVSWNSTVSWEQFWEVDNTLLHIHWWIIKSISHGGKIMYFSHVIYVFFDTQLLFPLVPANECKLLLPLGSSLFFTFAWPSLSRDIYIGKISIECPGVCPQLRGNDYSGSFLNNGGGQTLFCIVLQWFFSGFQKKSTILCLWI
jgi:hypothetical protein